MKISEVYDDGALIPEQIYSMNSEDLLAKIQRGVNNIAALALGSNHVI